MWISGFCLRAATPFYPQPHVWKEELFHRLCGRNFGWEKLMSFPHRISPHSTGAVEKFWSAESPGSGQCTFLASPRKVPKEGDLRGAEFCAPAQKAALLRITRRALLHLVRLNDFKTINFRLKTKAAAPLSPLCRIF